MPMSGWEAGGDVRRCRAALHQTGRRSHGRTWIHSHGDGRQAHAVADAAGGGCVKERARKPDQTVTRERVREVFFHGLRRRIVRNPVGQQRRQTMQVSQSRAARWAITSGLAALLAIAAAGFPTKAHAFVCNGQFDLLQKGYCSTTTTQGCGTSFDAACPAGETCKTFGFFDPGDPEHDGADQLRISLSVGTSTITGPTGAPDNMTVHKIRFDLDCVQNSGGNGTNTLCMDQGDVVEYMGDATITTDCPGVTWTSSQPLGGVGANEVVFTPSTAIVIPQSCAPSQASPPPACGGCKLEFGLRVVHQEPAGSDATPQIVEEAAGYIQGQGDAVCNEGLTGSLQSGSTQTANMPICPSCTIDQCNLGCDEQTTGECTAQTASTACADTDGNACTTAGCDGSGTCDQDHSVQVCTTHKCNKGSDPTTGQCTPQPASTPCGDTDGNTCTTAGCELNTAGVGVCVQTHLFASNSTPCADTDNNACTTAGCNGQGVCDQTHMMCSLGCFTRTPGFWGLHPAVTRAVLGGGLPSCGLVVNTTAPATPVSATEDICSVGTDSKANNTSPQQVQLIRQCMSAALNLAATAHAPQPGDCNSVFPGITQMFNTCCTGPTSVCDSGASPGAIDASGCIGSLDRFNSLETTIDIGVSQGSANPGPCQASKNNGFLNPGRNLGSK